MLDFTSLHFDVEEMGWLTEGFAFPLGATRRYLIAFPIR